jgi:hypothetical protein
MRTSMIRAVTGLTAAAAVGCAVWLAASSGEAPREPAPTNVSASP